MAQESSIAVPTRKLPRGAGDACLAAVAFGLRSVILLALALVVWALANEVRKSFSLPDELAGWLEISLFSDESLPLRLAIAWGCFLLIGLLRKARTIEVGEAGIELRFRLWRTLILARSEMRSVTRVSQAAAFLAMCWPRWQSDFRSSVATTRGWYRVVTARRVVYICPGSGDLFESALRERLQIVPAVARRGFGKVAAGWALGFFIPVLATVPLLLVASLIAIPPKLSEPNVSSASRFVLERSIARLDPAKDRDKWTYLLLNAVAKGDAALVRQILVAGTEPGAAERIFLLSRYHRHPCGPSLEEIAKRSNRALDPEFVQLLRAPGVRFRFADSFGGSDLIQALQCIASEPARHLPVVLYLDAARRMPAEELRSLPQRFPEEFVFIVEGDDGELRKFALELLQPGLAALLESQAAPAVVGVLEALARLERDRDPHRKRDDLFVAARFAKRTERAVRTPEDLRFVDAAGRSVAYRAAELGIVPLAERALAVTDSKVRTKAGATLLHAAAAGGDLAFAKRILSAGVSPKEATHDGRTPMHYARGWEMVYFLRERGLDPNARDQRGRTPLHDAALRGDLEAARTLIAFGAQRDARDLFGNRPLDYAPKEPPRPKPKPAAKGKAAATAKPEPRVWVLWEELLRIPDTIGGG